MLLLIAPLLVLTMQVASVHLKSETLVHLAKQEAPRFEAILNIEEVLDEKPGVVVVSDSALSQAFLYELALHSSGYTFIKMPAYFQNETVEPDLFAGIPELISKINRPIHFLVTGSLHCIQTVLQEMQSHQLMRVNSKMITLMDHEMVSDIEAAAIKTAISYHPYCKLW